MSNIDNIKSRVNTYLPKFILESNIFRDIFKSIIYESNYLDDYIKSITNELNISTAIKSIDRWERLAGLDNKMLDIDERRDSVIKKFSSQVHANYYNFLQLLKTYDDTTELKEIIGEYRIEIKTKNYISYDDFLNYLSIINSYKPAHIGVSVEVNREYTTSYYMSNMSTNFKTITTNIEIDSPKDININKSCINYIYNQNRCTEIKMSNKLFNNHSVNYVSAIIVQRYKTITV